MADFVNFSNLSSVNPAGAGSVSQAKKSIHETSEQGGDFKNILLDSLDKVNALQQDAADAVEGLIRGDTQDMAEVFSAMRKSEVAFSLLMEIRNKMVDAYNEIQQIRF